MSLFLAAILFPRCISEKPCANKIRLKTRHNQRKNNVAKVNGAGEFGGRSERLSGGFGDPKKIFRL